MIGGCLCTELTEGNVTTRPISPRSRLNEVIRGKRGVTPDTALRLARVTGMSAGFWLGLQQDWDLWHAQRSTEALGIARLEPLAS